ncbi:hypothetical protein BC828DRAFT_388204 [Blastocladiella britannica]|nr:hypothetical protein BC828DRAFT_388204 [Blastocladiella britannica]
MATVTIAPEYGYVILGATTILLHYVKTSTYVTAARKKYGVKYPDMGSGLYANKLSEKDWIAFNNAQRVHGNYLEELPTAITLLLTSGLFQPTIAAAGAVSYILGRELYTRGYVANGPEGRARGFAFKYPPLFAWLGITVYGAIKMTGWI